MGAAIPISDCFPPSPSLGCRSLPYVVVEKANGLFLFFYSSDTTPLNPLFFIGLKDGKPPLPSHTVFPPVRAVLGNCPPFGTYLFFARSSRASVSTRLLERRPTTTPLFFRCLRILGPLSNKSWQSAENLVFLRCFSFFIPATEALFLLVSKHHVFVALFPAVAFLSSPSLRVGMPGPSSNLLFFLLLGAPPLRAFFPIFFCEERVGVLFLPAVFTFTLC